MPSSSIMSQQSTAPPIPRWGLTPFEDEPAHAFFLRLAALNGQQAIPAYAMSLGLNGRNIDPQQMLSFCEQLPIQCADRLRSATPSISKKTVTIRGEDLRHGRDWSIRERRYCVACLKVAPFHRFWFDLPIIRVCPYHRTELVGELGGMKRAWHDPTLSSDFALQSCSPLSCDLETGAQLSRYILGRLRSLPHSPIEVLEPLRLWEAVYFCGIVGRLLEQGWTPLPEGDVERLTEQYFREIGLKFLSAGGSVIDLLESHIRNSPNNVEGAFNTKDMQSNIGWLYNALHSKQYREPLRFLLEATTQLLAKRDACRRLKRKFPVPEQKRRAREIAAALGLRIDEVELLAQWQQGPHGYATDSLNLEIIKLRSEQMISAESVAEILGVSSKRLAKMRCHKIILPVIPGGAGKSGQYDRDEILGLLSNVKSRVVASLHAEKLIDLDDYRYWKFCSYTEVLSGILDGSITVGGWDANKIGLQAALLFPPRRRANSEPTQALQQTSEGYQLEF